MSLRRGAAVLWLVGLAACPPPAMEPTLDFSSRPSAVEPGGEVTLTVHATTAQGTAGSGTVSLTAGVGTFSSDALSLDGNGSAQATWSCSTGDVGCSGRVTLTASWAAITDTAVVTVAAAGTGGGAGSDDAGTGGGSASVTVPPLPLPPNDVLLWGTLTTGACEDAIVRLDAGTQPVMGVPCAADRRTARVFPNGGVVYRDPVTQQLLAVVRDAPAPDGAGTKYPTDVSKNDVVVPTPRCATPQALSDFKVRPVRGTVVYRCNGGGDWYEGTRVVPGLSNAEVLALGLNDTALVSAGGQLQVVDASGARVSVQGLSTVPVLARSHPNGFLAVRDTPRCELWRINATGAAMLLGAYTDEPPTYAGNCAGQIDSNGVLFTTVQNIGGFVTARRPLAPEMAGPAYVKMVPETNWAVGSYRVQMNDTRGLITGP